MIENLTEHQPHLIVTLPDGVHVVSLKDIRDCRNGLFLGDCALMAQLLAVALLDEIDGKY